VKFSGKDRGKPRIILVLVDIAAKLTTMKKEAGSLLITCLVSSLTLKMEVVPSFETPVNFYHNNQLHIPEESTLNDLEEEDNTSVTLTKY
jgi:hypothetical protein